MESIEKLQELLDLIEDKANSTPAEKLAMIGVISERYKEIFNEEIIDMLLERVEWQIEGDIVELEHMADFNYDDVPF
jgi:hypothetical protein